MTRAVVFAYHNVGVRCLRVLLAHGVEVPLVVTHADNPSETIWYESVAGTAAECGIATIAPDDPNTPETLARISALAPEFLFSFYYRRMLKDPLVALPACGALNMHGSLLPRYRGRAPVNWAVLNGERETGATLHYMTAKPDAGDIVAQIAVPILPDDTAREAFDKVAVAAEIALDGVLPALLAGIAPRRPQDHLKATYYGGRRPEDGMVDWERDATTIHNLVRAVAPPYPGAFTVIGGVPARMLRTRILDRGCGRKAPPALVVRDGRILAQCGGGGTLAIAALELGGKPAGAAEVVTRFGTGPIPLATPVNLATDSP
jgi:methionyl-tRNA formyltransferase